MVTAIVISKIRMVREPQIDVKRGATEEEVFLADLMVTNGQQYPIDGFWWDDFFWVTNGRRRVLWALILGWAAIAANEIDPGDYAERKYSAPNLKSQ